MAGQVHAGLLACMLACACAILCAMWLQVLRKGICVERDFRGNVRRRARACMHRHVHDMHAPMKGGALRTRLHACAHMQMYVHLQGAT